MNDRIFLLCTGKCYNVKTNFSFLFVEIARSQIYVDKDMHIV